MPRIVRHSLLLLALVAPPTAWAQAWSYPSFQPPRLVTREFNFAAADAGGPGTSLLFQWREESGPRSQLSLDVGLADPAERGADLVAFIGGQLALRPTGHPAGDPLDLLYTVGANAAFGDFTLFRIPVGLSLGHRFELDQGLALTPYIHPRVSLDLCSNCGGDSDLALTFDLGANLELSPRMSLRASLLLAGNDRWDSDAFGVSLAITPPSLNGVARSRR